VQALPKERPINADTGRESLRSYLADKKLQFDAWNYTEQDLSFEYEPCIRLYPKATLSILIEK